MKYLVILSLIFSSIALLRVFSLSPSFGAFKLSTIATSTLPLALEIATSSSQATLEAYSTATTSLRLDTDSAKGGCIVLKDSDGSGYSYLSASGGTLTTSATSCL